MPWLRYWPRSKGWGFPTRQENREVICAHHGGVLHVDIYPAHGGEVAVSIHQGELAVAAGNVGDFQRHGTGIESGAFAAECECAGLAGLGVGQRGDSFRIVD